MILRMLMLFLLVSLPVTAGGAEFRSLTVAAEAPVLASFVQDLDLDGRPDFAFLAEDRRFILFFQEADGGFRRAETAFVMPDGTDALDLADTDGDGVPDICLTVGGRRLMVVSSAGDTGFWAGLAQTGRVSLDSAVIRDLAGGGGTALPLTDSLHRAPDLFWDLDDDGRQDLIYPHFQGLELMLNSAGEGKGGGPFARARLQTVPRGPRVSLQGARIELVREMPRPRDLDGDGRMELVFEPRPVYGLGQLECAWWHGQAAGEPYRESAHELQFGIGESVTEYLLDDLNGDGEPDLALLSTGFDMDNPGGQGTVAGGGGSFFEEKVLRIWLTIGQGGPMGRKPAGQWTSEINIWQETVIRHRDLTGDGVDDLCLYYWKGLINAKLVVDVHPGQGNGRFGKMRQAQKFSFDNARRSTTITDRDMDGDGIDDLVLAAEKKLRIFRGTGGLGGSEPYGSKPWAVLDLWPETEDEEGKDTVTLRIGSSGSSISYDDNRLSGINVLDVNDDGALDIVLVNRPREWDMAARGQPPVTLMVHLSSRR